MRALSPGIRRIRVDSPAVRLGPRHRRMFLRAMLTLRIRGAVAQLVAHLHGMEGVRGSSPLSSTDFCSGSSHDRSPRLSPCLVLFVGVGLVSGASSGLPATSPVSKKRSPGPGESIPTPVTGLVGVKISDLALILHHVLMVRGLRSSSDPSSQ